MKLAIVSKLPNRNLNRPAQKGETLTLAYHPLPETN
jgi:hypothetical protein